ncbi:DNA segregation ATPase FtsK/SpoIIIE, S-DNA-T family [Geodermatophilus sabuli]|uniref:DNA segregation ATPase FtsK/SpoIIIE, S-DNA-T family n=2 Tax=Geodermatophilus sabuli TaxID=1564158 RepID=A0A285EH10_9ACTN|nr:DNA segregation ATPase FtsK/SpoIIIE, S-DNA-T family [Geodermatophilus sabuli]
MAADDEHLDAVAPRLVRALRLPPAGLWSGSTRLPEGLPLTDPALAHGAVLGLGRPGPRPADGERSSALELHVVGGPEAGSALPLPRGRHVVGRGAAADVDLADPDVSRRHLLVEVGAGELTVCDLGSTNGSRLDDDPLDERPRTWPAGSVLHVGASTLATAGPADPRASVQPAPGGRVRLRPPPRMEPLRPEVDVTFPAAPTAVPRRRLAWVAVVLPALGGVVLAWVLGVPHFLFFALLSPVVAVGTWLSDRWTGRRSGRRTAAAHAAEVATAQARLQEALRADVQAARAAHPDLARLAGAARRRSAVLWQRQQGDGDALTVRLGSGPGRSAVTCVQVDGTRERQTATRLPVVVALGVTGGLAVTGPRSHVVGVLSGVVAQLVALHAPGEVELVLLTDNERLPDWSWLRWLPHVGPGSVHSAPAGGDDGGDAALAAWVTTTAARRRAGAHEGGSSGPSGATGAGPGWLVALVDRPAGPRLSAALRAARDAGVVTLTCGSSLPRLPAAPDAVLELAGETGDAATLHRAGTVEQAGITVDRLPARVAEALARDLAPLAPPIPARVVPRRVRLLDHPGHGLRIDADGTATGTWPRSRDRLVTALGRTAEGEIVIDLCRQGPHVLVAGTTGSGKSELLQTLIAGLALGHPPDRCSFLLVDYKGGAAFAEAAALPHTVGLLTDLDGTTTARALRSLGAELTRREALLAARGARDIAALPDDEDLARLVIVVDEFAGLAEELPTFVTGLVGIAQRGRSLGVHLVLATQRPGGVVSPEIRANCTLRICLRTTDEGDSRDVLGSPSAAHLPTDVPGRAYLRVGGSTPLLFQAARVAGAPPSLDEDGARVRPWNWPLTTPGAEDAPPAGRTDLARLTQALDRHASASGIRRPHRPWCPPLPDVIRAEDLPPDSPGPPAGAGAGAAGAGRRRLRIGLLDRPDTQSQQPLCLDLERGGGWLAVGGARSGRTTFLRTVLAEAVAALSPGELHVHVLDHGGGALARAAAHLPHTGTAVGRGDLLRTVRLLDRLAQEVSVRRAESPPGATPHLLLLVDGVEELSSLLDEVDPTSGSAGLLRLVRDGAAAGLTCVLTAERAVPGGRLAGAVTTRLVLPLPDRADYAIAGVPARSVPEHRPAGRALLGEDGVACQLALPRQVLSPAMWRPTAPGGRPLTIPELPADPLLPLPGGTAGSEALRLPVGPGGDEGAVQEVDLVDAGGLLVVGSPGSGRSTALDAFTAHLVAGGVPVVRVGRGAVRASAGGRLTWLDCTDVEGWRSWLGSLQSTEGAVVVDDLGTVAESPVVTALGSAEPTDRVVLVAAGSAQELAAVYRGPVTALRRRRSGLLLCPAPGDADLLGIRLPRTAVPRRPGSGWLVTAGTPQRVQVARRRPAGPAVPSAHERATANR